MTKFRHKPKLPYCGLTIVLANPSRFDTRELLTGNAGTWFLDTLRQAANGKLIRFHCDIRTSNTRDEGLLEGTRVVFCLGETAQHEWFAPQTELKAQRGSPHVAHDDIIYLSSFTPQDSHDFQAYEQRLNANYRGAHDDDAEADDSEVKGHKGATKRTNYKFWLGMDTHKCVRLLNQGLANTGRCAVSVYPDAERVVSELQSTKNSTLYLDIETLFDRTLTCVGFAFEGRPVYVFPIRRYHGGLAYDVLKTCKMMAALGTAMRDNLCVTHNGHAFDWLVLAHHYRIPFGRRLYDTMIAQNRCWPEAEKSLGHCLSLWTDEAYHKDDGVFDPHNTQQEEALWNYNAKDVHALRLLKAAFDKAGVDDPGLGASIEQGQQMIYPYMVAALRGIRADAAKITEIVTENDRLLTQYLRIAKVLIGPDNYAILKGKSEAGFLSSNKQAAKYFYEIQKYKCPHKTDTGEDAVDVKAMLKLAIALKKKGVENPVIPLRLKFAEVKKETSMLSNLNLWPEKAYL